MITKKFGIDFHSVGGALTLRECEVSEEDNGISGMYSRTHSDGWNISGEVHEDYYTWVNDFIATHQHYGVVAGNFEEEIRASSEEAFEHFWLHHEPEAWDYGDI